MAFSVNKGWAACLSETAKLVFLHKTLNAGQRGLQKTVEWLKLFVLSVIWEKKNLDLTSKCFIHYNGN